MATITWIAGASGDFADGGNWSGGTVPGSADDAEIDATGTYSVASSLDETVESLTLSSSGTLALTAGTFAIDLSGASPQADLLTVGASAGIDIGAGAVLQVAPGASLYTILLDGAVNIAPGGELEFRSSGTVAQQANLYGSGTITLGGAGSELALQSSLSSENNQIFLVGISSTVVGAGTIQTGAPGSLIGFAIGPNGVLDANQESSTILVTGEGAFSNISASYGVAISEATNGGILDFKGETIRDDGFSGSVIQAVGSGSRVVLNSSTVEGGELATFNGGVIETGNGGAGLYGQTDGGIAVTGSLRVNNGTELSLSGTVTNSGVISVASTGGSTTLRLAPVLFGPGSNPPLVGRVTLAGSGAVTLSDNANNLISAAQTPGRSVTLLNEGNTISGAGQIGGGSAMNLINRSLIDATGTNALIFDIASGTATNGVHGVLEGSGAGGLSITGGTITNWGAITALDGSSVTFGASVDVTNDVSGTLTSGTWLAMATGNGATLNLAGSPITDDAARITLSGSGSVFESGGVALETSLTTIVAGGRLTLLDDRGWTSTLALTDEGLLTLGGGDFAPGALTVASGGTVSGFGDITSDAGDEGLIEARGGTLTLSGAVTGSGALKIASNSTLILGDAAAVGQEVLFGVGLRAVLELGDPAGFSGVIADWGLRDTIDLANIKVSSAQVSGDTLEVSLTGGGSLDYSLSNPPTGLRILLSSDGDGGTNLTLFNPKAASPAVALLGQSMAAMPAGSSASSLHAREPGSATLATISPPRAA